MVLNKKQRELLEFLCDSLRISLGISNPQEPDEWFPKGRVVILERKIQSMLEMIESFNPLPKSLSCHYMSNLNHARNLLIEFERSGKTCDDTLIEIDDILRDSYNSIVWILANNPTAKD